MVNIALVQELLRAARRRGQLSPICCTLLHPGRDHQRPRRSLMNKPG